MRAGALLPLLPADVDTLTGYGGCRPVHLPTAPGGCGCSRCRAGPARRAYYDSGRIRSRESGVGWVLRIDGGPARSFELQASMRTLRKPFAPCAVAIGGRRLAGGAWSYDRADGVLTATVRGRDPRLVARRRC